MHTFTNNLKTVLLLGLMTGMILAIGSFWGKTGLIMALVFAAVSNIGAYFFSHKIAIAAMGGQLVDERSAPDLVNMVRRLADNAGLPMPKVYICPQQAPNAFATGRNPKNAAVAATHGALQLLSYDELEGVMAHELAHVKNRDTLISAIAATIAGALSMLAHMAFFMGGSRRDGEGSAFGAIGALLMIILAPIGAMLIQMAISRSREFVADADGARIAGSPDGLINALRKLESTAKQIPMQGESPAFNHMFIVNPLSGVGSGFAGLFRTHPPTEKRIAALAKLRGQIV